MATRNLIVIGASAGGVNALIEALADGEPMDAAVLVAMHMPADGHTALPEILTRETGIPSLLAGDGMQLQPGVILVAPPDHHLLVGRRSVRLSTGPRENRARPAVDPLFRSAARSHGGRVVGVILSGMLGDGAMGLAAVRGAGGVALVQEPEDAIFSGMPSSALRLAGADLVLRADEMRAALERLTTEELEEPMPTGDDDPDVVEMDAADIQRVTTAGSLTTLTCPDCNGALWETREAGVSSYRCRVGHAFSIETLLTAQGEAIEEALWAAIRALEEHATLLTRSAGRLEEQRRESATIARMRSTADEALAQAETIRRLIERVVRAATADEETTSQAP